MYYTIKWELISTPKQYRTGTSKCDICVENVLPNIYVRVQRNKF